MTKTLWTIIFVLVITQASSFAYVLNMNNQLELLEEQVVQVSPEFDSVIQNQALLNTDIHHIIKVIKGLIIQVQYLTNEVEKDKVKKQERVKQDNLQMG
jgi:predicted NUDIX family phosphoesterase